MNARIFIGDSRVDAIPVDDRGLAYGDGLFETMRIHAGTVPLWPRHRARLQLGAGRLGLALPSMAVLDAGVGEAIAGRETGVLKLLVTRGRGGRGYAPPPSAQPMWMLSLHPLPPDWTARAGAGLRLHWCDTRLADQPALAGIKHCNRLEQILARAECDRAGCDEGLLLDPAGGVVSATSANLLLLGEGRWRTPAIERCGIAGVCRGWLVEQGLVEVATMNPAQVGAADALALCNAVRGILPVASVGAAAFAPHPAVGTLQAAWAAAFPMFHPLGELA